MEERLSLELFESKYIKGKGTRKKVSPKKVHFLRNVNYSDGIREGFYLPLRGLDFVNSFCSVFFAILYNLKKLH